MRMLAIAFVFAFGAATAQAAEYSKAISIIEEEGQFLFTDGSSYYLFFKDGYFDSGPLTLSGRTIPSCVSLVVAFVETTKERGNGQVAKYRI